MSPPAQPRPSGAGSAARPSRRLDRLLAREPAGLSGEFALAWRVLAMARAGYGWEDIAVASRGWACGSMSEARARALVTALHGGGGTRGGR